VRGVDGDAVGEGEECAPAGAPLRIVVFALAVVLGAVDEEDAKGFRGTGCSGCSGAEVFQDGLEFGAGVGRRREGLALDGGGLER